MGEQNEGRPATLSANAAWSVLSLLLSGMLAWGGIGWLLDWWLGTSFIFPTLLIVGVAGSLYLVIKRFGVAAGEDTTSTNESPRNTDDDEPDGKT